MSEKGKNVSAICSEFVKHSCASETDKTSRNGFFFFFVRCAILISGSDKNLLTCTIPFRLAVSDYWERKIKSKDENFSMNIFKFQMSSGK